MGAGSSLAGEEGLVTVSTGANTSGQSARVSPLLTALQQHEQAEARLAPVTSQAAADFVLAASAAQASSSLTAHLQGVVSDFSTWSAERAAEGHKAQVQLHRRLDDTAAKAAAAVTAASRASASVTALETQVAPIASLVEQVSYLAASIQQCQSTLAMLQSSTAAARARPSRQTSAAITPSISRSSSMAQPAVVVASPPSQAVAGPSHNRDDNVRATSVAGVGNSAPT